MRGIWLAMTDAERITLAHIAALAILLLLAVTF